MKTYLLKPFKRAVPLIALSAALISAGCAGTEHSRSTGTYLDDKAIGAKVKAALIDDDLVNGLDVNVDTFRGEVQLSGFVNTQEQKEHASEIARNVPGVVAVRNNVALKPGPAAIGTPGARVSGSATARAETLPGRNIQIHASNGKAIVRGTVDSEAEKQSIERKLREIPGIHAVENHLTVRSRD